MEFSIYWIDGDELVEGVTHSKYLGRPLDQSNKDSPEILQNTWKAQKVWVQIGKALRREREDTHVLVMFNWEVLQADLLLGSEPWAMSEEMMILR